MNVSIVIPVRIESLEREANLRYVISYLIRMPFVHIDIIESDKKQYFQCPKHERIRYKFILDNSLIFHRTYYLNILLRSAKYSIVGIWDTDIIASEMQIKEAIKFIKDGCVLSFPYNGNVLFLDKEESALIRNSLVEVSCKLGKRLMGRPSMGGAFFVNREKYMAAGGENECFYGWGYEDTERIKRLEILDLPIARAKNPIFHLYHSRVVDEYQEQNIIYNLKVFLYVCNKDKQNLSEIIDTRTDMFSYLNNCFLVEYNLCCEDKF